MREIESQKRCTRFLIDSNLFIAAVKGRWTRSSELLFVLFDGPFDLVANRALLSEYEKYAEELEAEYIFNYLRGRVVMVDLSEDEVETCRPFFPKNQAADIVHAATCLHTGAVLISNDRHFEKIGRSGLVDVWTISEAMKRLLSVDKSSEL